MSSFVSYLISGISLGSVYAIIALGYTMEMLSWSAPMWFMSQSAAWD